MRKKLFALIMVPIILVMGGTYAFSAWSGTANAYFGQSAATVSFTESIVFNSTNAAMTPLAVDNGHHFFSNVVSGTPSFIIGNETGGVSSDVNLYANVSNLVPGDWVSFTVKIVNTGTATINASYLISNRTVINGDANFLSGIMPIQNLLPLVTSSFLDSTASGNFPGHIALVGPLTIVDAATNGNSQGYISHGQSVSYNVFIVLPSNTPAYLSGCSGDTLEMSLPISVAQ